MGHSLTFLGDEYFKKPAHIWVSSLTRYATRISPPLCRRCRAIGRLAFSEYEPCCQCQQVDSQIRGLLSVNFGAAVATRGKAPTGSPAIRPAGLGAASAAAAGSMARAACSPETALS